MIITKENVTLTTPGSITGRRKNDQAGKAWILNAIEQMDRRVENIEQGFVLYDLGSRTIIQRMI